MTLSEAASKRERLLKYSAPSKKREEMIKECDEIIAKLDKSNAMVEFTSLDDFGE